MTQCTFTSSIQTATLACRVDSDSWTPSGLPTFTQMEAKTSRAVTITCVVIIGQLVFTWNRLRKDSSDVVVLSLPSPVNLETCLGRAVGEGVHVQDITHLRMAPMARTPYHYSRTTIL